MGYLTNAQYKMVRALVDVWRTGRTYTPIFDTLFQIEKEEPYGNMIARFLQGVYQDIQSKGAASFRYSDGHHFEQFLRQSIDGIVSEAKKAKSSIQTERDHSYYSNDNLDQPLYEFDGYTNKYRGERETNCWRCKRNLMASDDSKCPKCRWLRCECGACGCNYPSQRGDVFGGTGV